MYSNGPPSRTTFPSMGRPADRPANVFLLGTRIQKRAHVGFGEYGTARRYGVDGRIAHGQPAERFGILAHQTRHHFDERTSTTCAHVVHALFGHAGQIYKLRVFAAHFQNDVGFGHVALDGALERNHFLNEGYIEQLSHAHARRTGHGDARRRRAQMPHHAVHSIEQVAVDLRAVIEVVRIQHEACFSFFEYHLDGLRADIDSEIVHR